MLGPLSRTLQTGLLVFNGPPLPHLFGSPLGHIDLKCSWVSLAQDSCPEGGKGSVVTCYMCFFVPFSPMRWFF